MRPIRSEKNATGTILRGIILFVGLIIAGFYGMRDQWAASCAGLLAAAFAFFSKGSGPNKK